MNSGFPGDVGDSEDSLDYGVNRNIGYVPNFCQISLDFWRCPAPAGDFPYAGSLPDEPADRDNSRTTGGFIPFPPFHDFRRTSVELACVLSRSPNHKQFRCRRQRDIHCIRQSPEAVFQAMESQECQ